MRFSGIKAQHILDQESHTQIVPWGKLGPTK